MTLQQYVGQFTLPNTALNLTVGGTPVALTAGTRFAFGYTGETAVQFLEHLEDIIQTASATGTVTYDPLTGLVTISFVGVETIVWNDTDLRDLLGFTGNLAGSDTYTADNTLRYVWRPSTGLSDYPGDLTTWWVPESSTKVVRSKDGTTTTVKGSEIFGTKIEYDKLPKNDVIKSSATKWQALETWWRDVVHEGNPFRCYPDRTLNASTSYHTAVWKPEDEETGIGSFAEFRKRNIGTYNGLWIVEMELWKYIA